ncbi:MAG: MotA/TolQ/ExbB proton channel family protein [Bacteroidales bacterium]|nr:MotA/TolQ/ExbB proton channel family protein [Bacteroidales bacterium]MBP5135199.1 MotA/TolQ/ExbB proton channel family protein [Paludibacteraceae bacterium]
MNLNLILQVPQMMADSMNVATTEVAEKVVEMNYWEMATKGGWIMVPLILLFLLSVYITVERIVTIRSASKEDPTFMNRIKDYILEGKVDSAMKLCQQTNSPSARMIEKGVSRLGRPMQDMMVAIENVGNLEISKLEKGLSLLATVAGGAPMIGFFGTVTGMVKAFFDMANSGNDVNMTVLSAGIYQAMITTVGGLAVGIVAYFFYNYLVSRVDSVIRKMEARTMEFLDILNEPA